MKVATRGAVSGSAEQPGVSQKSAANLARRAELGELKRMRTRAALLRAAISVLGTEGGRVATVDNVISASGMARGTFYNYFESRERLFEAVAYELSHDFNSALDASLVGGADPAKRASTWIRQYLRRVRRDRQWGWAFVNVSLNGPKLFGDESYNEALQTIAAGCATGVFHVGNRDAALNVALGGVLVSAMGILQGPTKPDHPEVTAELVLRALGVPASQAQRVVSQPLPELPRFAGPSS
jgi:AcrR family transcriptional regulator